MIVDDDLDNLQLFKDIFQYGRIETHDFNPNLVGNHMMVSK
jgi:hypothetical protein